MKGFPSIRARMMLLILVATTLILAAVILWSYMAARHRLQADMEAKAVFLADSAARQIDAELGVLQGIVHGMALALQSQRLALEFADVRDMQTAALRQNSGIYGICVALEPDFAPPHWPDLAAWEYRSGNKLLYLDLSGTTFAHTREDWYTLPKQLNRPVWSEPYIFAGVLMVTYSVPVYIEKAGVNHFAGVVTCDLSLDGLEAMIDKLPLGKGGYGILISRNGTFIAHPKREFVLNETVFSIAEEHNAPSLREIGQRMVSGVPGIVASADFLSDDLAWLAFTPLRSGNWTMAAIISRDEMNAAIYRLSRNQTAIGITGLLFLGLAVGMISRSITRPIRNLQDAADVLASGDLDASLPAPQGRDEVARLTTAFSGMRDSLKRQVADLKETTAVRERMHSELTIARDIQMGLVPKTFPPFPAREDIDLYAEIKPAREVGGDFYDFFLLDQDHIALAIGDVSGKGVPAALFMAVTRSFLRSAFHVNSDPAKVLAHVNNELVEGNESCMFVTLFCAVLDCATGELQYANAGHNPPAVRRRDGRVEWISGSRSVVAGAMPDAPYCSENYRLPDGSALILYTDGVTEALNPSNELYGEDRLTAVLAGQKAASECREITTCIVDDVAQFAEGAEQSDDITILVIKYRQVVVASEVTESVAPALDFTLQNTAEEVIGILDEVQHALDLRNTPVKLVHTVRLAVEELLLNTVQYGYDDDRSHDIHLQIITGSPLQLSITDDAAPFNPLTDAPQSTLIGSVEERPIGGLGLHLLKTMGVVMQYKRLDGHNVLHLEFPQ